MVDCAGRRRVESNTINSTFTLLSLKLVFESLTNGQLNAFIFKFCNQIALFTIFDYFIMKNIEKLTKTFLEVLKTNLLFIPYDHL